MSGVAVNSPLIASNIAVAGDNAAEPHLVRQKPLAGPDANEPGHKIHLRAAAFLRMRAGSQIAPL